MATLWPVSFVQAAGGAGTMFGVYVPPGFPAAGLLVTAVQDGTTVNIVDDAADGDDDDTHTGVLDEGQSYVIYIREGAIDDNDGPQAARGDYFRVQADKPVIVCNFTTSLWAHDFVPATNNTMIGADFYFYAFNNTFYTSGRVPQAEIIAYSDDTQMQLFDVTNMTDTQPIDTSGKTSVVSDTDGITVTKVITLSTGEYHAITLEVGHTYHLLANKKVTLQYGMLGHASIGRRDGGVYVPGKNGSSTGRTFYFGIPHDSSSECSAGICDEERELRIVTYDEGADVSVCGWDTISSTWDNVYSAHLGPHGHLELIGDELGYNENGEGYYFFKVLATTDVSVFETNWFETGIYGTSDIATYLSPETSIEGRRFEAYLGPPGNEPNLETGSGEIQLTHLYVFASEATNAIAYDSDAYGEWIELYNTTTETVDLNGWTLTNGSAKSVVLTGTIAPQDYYLLEYHQKATTATANLVYGDRYPYFKLGNGEDTLTLQGVLTGGIAYSDTFSYDETWASHGVYTAMARITPTEPANHSDNWVNASTLYANTVNNLGAYWGSPGEENEAYNGDGSGPQQGVVINEIMTGRIWQRFTVSDTVSNTVAGKGGYYDIALDTKDWESINNGNGPEGTPGSIVTDGPEGPYIIVESDKYISVMNTNWNDNWMAYATPTRYPDPAVIYLPSHYRRSAGKVITFTADVWTGKTALYDPITTIEIPTGVEYITGSYDTPAQILSTAVVTETQHPDGSWTLTWKHGVTMMPAVSYQFVVAATSSITGWLRSVASTSGIDAPDPLVGERYTSQDVAVVVVEVGDDEVRKVDLVINEVMVRPPGSDHEWIELYNTGDTEVVLTGIVLTDGGDFEYTIPKVAGADLALPVDSYVVIYLEDGTNNQSDLYAGSGSSGRLNNAEDRLSLFASSQFNTNTLIDFVQWDDNGVFGDETADDLAVAAGQWPDGDYVTSALTGDTLGRDRQGTDEDNSTDWENTCGVDSGAPTPGAINWTSPGLNLTKSVAPTVIYPGERVVYTYWLINSGEEPLSNIAVSDDTCNPVTFIRGDGDGDGELDEDEEWIYSCSAVLHKDTINYATATGETKGSNPVQLSSSAMASVDVIPRPVNRPPNARDDEGCTHRGETRNIDLLGNDTDPERERLEIIAVSTPSTGTMTHNVSGVTYSPPSTTYTGIATFTYTIIDEVCSVCTGGPLTDTANVTVYVEKNLPPIANDDIVYAIVGMPRVIHVLNNDEDNNHYACDVANFTVVAVGQPITGSVTRNDTTVTYVQPTPYTGTIPYTVAFTYTMSDNANGVIGPLTDTAWVTLTVVYPVGGYTKLADASLWSRPDSVLKLGSIGGSIGIGIMAVVWACRLQRRAAERKLP